MTQKKSQQGMTGSINIDAIGEGTEQVQTPQYAADNTTLDVTTLKNTVMMSLTSFLAERTVV